MPDNIVPYQEKHPRIDPSAYIDPTARIIGDVVIKRGAGVWAGAVVRGDDGQVVIEEDSHVLEHCMVEAPRVPSVIGRGTIISHGAIVHGAVVGEECVIGIRAVLLDGVKVGNRCLVGAGAVVPPSAEIADGKLVLGLPGKVVRDMTEQDQHNARREWESLVQKSQVYKTYYEGRG